MLSMKKKLVQKTGLIGVIALSVISGSLMSVAVFAAIPDNGQINACYNNLTKTLRVVDPVGNCGAGSTAINWTQSAPKVVSQRIVALNGSSGQDIIVVPGFGTFKVAECTADYGTAAFTFVNTSGAPLDYIGDFVTGSSQTAIPNLQTIQNPVSLNGATQVVLSQGTGASSRVATVTVAGINQYPNGDSSCRFSAQSVTK